MNITHVDELANLRDVSQGIVDLENLPLLSSIDGLRNVEVCSACLVDTRDRVPRSWEESRCRTTLNCPTSLRCATCASLPPPTRKSSRSLDLTPAVSAL